MADRKSNLMGLLIGSVGAAMTLLSYSQPFCTPTQCLLTGLLVILTGLAVKEGILNI